MTAPCLRLLFLLGLGALPWSQAIADLVVVVNAKSAVEKLTEDQVVNIFMGRYRRLPSGVAAQPVDQPEDSPDRARFYQLLVHKDLSEINAYWARLVFSGKANPPHQAKSVTGVKAWLVSEPGAIGYLDTGELDSRFRVVLDLGN